MYDLYGPAPLDLNVSAYIAWLKEGTIRPHHFSPILKEPDKFFPEEVWEFLPEDGLITSAVIPGIDLYILCSRLERRHAHWRLLVVVDYLSPDYAGLQGGRLQRWGGPLDLIDDSFDAVQRRYRQEVLDIKLMILDDLARHYRKPNEWRDRQLRTWYPAEYKRRNS